MFIRSFVPSFIQLVGFWCLFKTVCCQKIMATVLLRFLGHVLTAEKLHLANQLKIKGYYVFYSKIFKACTGHLYLTHCCLLKLEPQPLCFSCNEVLTLDHLLISCTQFANIRLKHYSANTLEEVLTSGNYAHVLSFLSEINLYKKLYPETMKYW